MAKQAAVRVLKDETDAKGKRLFNPSRPHATVFSDGHSEAKYLQDGQYYRGDRTPIDGMTQRPNDPPKQPRYAESEEALPAPQDESRMDRLEASIAALTKLITEDRKEKVAPAQIKDLNRQ